MVCVADRMELIESLAEFVASTCFPKSVVSGPINSAINLSTYDFMQNSKLSLAKSFAVRGSDSGLKKAPAKATGKSHRRVAQLFITDVRSTFAIISPKRKISVNVISMKGHLASIPLLELYLF